MDSKDSEPSLEEGTWGFKDIDNCKKRTFQFHTPTNLDTFITELLAMQDHQSIIVCAKQLNNHSIDVVISPKQCRLLQKELANVCHRLDNIFLVVEGKTHVKNFWSWFGLTG